MTKAHRFSVSQVRVFPRVLKTQERMDPMIPGRAPVALPARLARACPRACRCLIPSVCLAVISPIYNQGALVISEAHMRLLFHILWPVLIGLETTSSGPGVLPVSTPRACSEYSPQTCPAVAGRPAVGP